MFKYFLNGDKWNQWICTVFESWNVSFTELICITERMNSLMAIKYLEAQVY